MQTPPLVSGSVRAAVVGASGIGKHHAKWLQALGAQVVAVAGSSAATAAATAASLHEQFGIEAAAYASLPEMLAEQNPDLVHVCTPPERHYEHVLQLADHRCHLLCEKPLTWDEAKPPAQLLAEAQEMVQRTDRPRRLTAVNLQYTAVPPAYYALCDRAGLTPEPPRRFFMHMDSRRDRNVYEIIWRELSPHTLSVMVAFCGSGRVDYDNVDLSLGERQCRARFLYQPDQGESCECELVVGTVLEGPLTRRFGINGVLADYEGRNDADGVFRTYLRYGDTEAESDDFMYLSMRGMLAAVTGQAPAPLASLATGLANEQMQLEILSRGKRL